MWSDFWSRKRFYRLCTEVTKNNKTIIIIIIIISSSSSSSSSSSIVWYTRRCYPRPWRWDKQVFPKRWLHTKNWRRATTQKLLSKMLLFTQISLFFSLLIAE
jgi:hypothetical protein